MPKFEIINDTLDTYEVVQKNSNIHYYVNVPKKTVVAVMDNCKDQFRNEVSNLLSKNSGDILLISSSFNNIKDTYKGKAQCIGDDKFELLKGMKIAREHMLEKYYKDYFEAILDVFMEFDRVTKEIKQKVFSINERYKKFKEINTDNFIAAEVYKQNI